jgi:hypothetical protein
VLRYGQRRSSEIGSVEFWSCLHDLSGQVGCCSHRGLVASDAQQPSAAIWHEATVRQVLVHPDAIGSRLRLGAVVAVECSDSEA